MREGTKKSRAPSGVDFMRFGVSISTKSLASKYSRTAWLNLARIINRSFNSGLLISRYRYFNLNSSLPSVAFSIKKGGVSDSLSMFNSFTSISISPVGIFRFLLVRSMTTPFICITNSRPSLLARSHNATSVSLLKTNWVMP